MNEIKYRLLEDRLGRPAGMVVVEYERYDYGLCRDDFNATGVVHIAVKPHGAEEKEPFFTVPVDQLERVGI